MTVFPDEQMVGTEQICDNKNTAPSPLLRQLEVENCRLRMIVAELLIKNEHLRRSSQNSTHPRFRDGAE
jgi:hypothetical protein